MINKNKISISIALSLLTLTSIAFAAPSSDSPIKAGNGTWVYDAIYDNSGNTSAIQAGLFVDNIKKYNQSSTATSKITQIFPYGGNVEMYCEGSGESPVDKSCTATEWDGEKVSPQRNFLVSYYPTFKNFIYASSGYESVKAYATAFPDTQIIATIDGRVDDASPSETLNHLNTLDEAGATLFADKVAQQLCADDRFDGIQFDIEPFSFTGGDGNKRLPLKGNGQKYFYTEIAKDFAGYYASKDDPAGINHFDEHYPNADPLHCVDAKHPNGRAFSVFTFTSQVTPDVAAVFTHHNNGYIVDSLYDLGDTPGGTLTSPDKFAELAAAEISKMQEIANENHIYYQFAIPAAASAHEYEKVGNISSGYTQLEYLNKVVPLIKAQANNPYYLGVDLWAWNKGMWWRDTTNPDSKKELFLPTSIDTGAGVEAYLQKNL